MASRPYSPMTPHANWWDHRVPISVMMWTIGYLIPRGTSATGWDLPTYSRTVASWRRWAMTLFSITVSPYTRISWWNHTWTHFPSYCEERFLYLHKIVDISNIQVFSNTYKHWSLYFHIMERNVIEDTFFVWVNTIVLKIVQGKCKI